MTMPRRRSNHAEKGARREHSPDAAFCHLSPIIYNVQKKVFPDFRTFFCECPTLTHMFSNFAPEFEFTPQMAVVRTASQTNTQPIYTNLKPSTFNNKLNYHEN